MIFTAYSAKTIAASVQALGEDELLQNIVVPVDFSECAENAIRFAVAIALRTGATIHLLHNVSVPVQTGEVLAVPIADLEREEAKRLGDLAVEITNWLDKERLRRIQVKHQVRVGFASEEIVNAAVIDHADLIVMGTRGAGKIAGAILGSNASAVVKNAQCPVLVVPEDAEFEGFKHIAYSTDLHEIKPDTVRRLVDFAGLFEAKLHIVHIIVDKDQFEPDQASLYKMEFGSAAPYENTSFHVVYADGKSTSEAIQSYVDANDIELVAMLTHNRSFWDKLFHPSVTKQIALHSNRPLLAFH
jgi:nucleotide-binding universal stress UspA family protein